MYYPTGRISHAKPNQQFLDPAQDRAAARARGDLVDDLDDLDRELLQYLFEVDYGAFERRMLECALEQDPTLSSMSPWMVSLCRSLGMIPKR